MDQDLASVPEFGEKVAGQEYRLRPGTYAVIYDAEGRVAVVSMEMGVFLPGGGVQPGESPEAALAREAREECGFELELLGEIGVADQLVFVRELSAYYRMRGVFFRATIRAEDVARPEDGHELVWLPPPEAERRLTRRSHAWAVREGIHWLPSPSTRERVG